MTLSPRRPPRRTRVFDSYWTFAAARQSIFFRRLAGEPPPWTEDPILQHFKFTNAYRASDRTSQYLIKQVIYTGDQEPAEVCFRTVLFKVFNRIETWEALAEAIGEISIASFDPHRYGKVLDGMRKQGAHLYSAAYIMPPVRTTLDGRKHTGHLHLISEMLEDGLGDSVIATSSLKDLYTLLHRYPSFGPFLAFQIAIDLNYGPALTFDEADFVVAGPGAREGLAKCFRDRADWSDEDLIYWTADRQEDEFERRGIQFRNLWGRPLKPVDCQNLFCEVAKYSRVAHPRFTPPGGRSRIKQRFASDRDLPAVWYPPKWGINSDAI